MKRRWILVLLVALFAFGPLACSKKEEIKAELSNETDRISYAIGMKIGKQMRQTKLELNASLLGRAVEDVLGDKALALTDDDMRAAIVVLNKRLGAMRMEEQKKMMDELEKKAEPNRVAGKKFLDENAKQEGVVVLESGMQYKVLKKGTGATPTASDTVNAKYRGTLIDGKEFDSGTAKFPVTGVIRGWIEALQLMKVGGKWELFIPDTLAYGAPGRPGIPPGSVLIFEVELLEIVGSK